MLTSRDHQPSPGIPRHPRVLGLGAPELVRVRVPEHQRDALVDALRRHRRNATQQASETYTRVDQTYTRRGGHERAVDDTHADLRAIERLLSQLELQPPGGGLALTGETQLMCEVIAAAAQHAVDALRDAHERFTTPGERCHGDELLAAARAAKALTRLQVELWNVDMAGLDD